MNIKTICLLTFCLLCLPISIARCQKTNFFPTDQVPAFNVPKIEKPPVIDGAIDADEWRQSVEIRGMANAQSNALIDRPHSFRVAWDDDHIYLAGRAHILPGHVLLKSRREKYTTGVVYDDAFEFGISLLGRNQAADEAESFFKFVVNFLGSGEYTKMYPAIGQYLYNWQPNMKIRSQLHDTPEGRFWEMEIAMDLKDLEMPRPHRAGDQIKLLLAHDGKNPGWVWAHVPSSTGYLVHTGFPTATLTDNRPYVQVEKLTGLDDEKINLQSVVYNPTGQPAQVNVSLQIRNEGAGSSKTAVNVAKVLDVPAQGSVRFDVDEAFPGLEYGGKGKRVGVFDFKVTQGQTPVYKYYLTFKKDEEKKLWKYEAKPVDFQLNVEYNPIRSTLWLAADTLDARLPEGVKAAGMTYRVRQGDKVVQEGRSSQLVYFKYQDFVQMPKLAPGTYEVDVSLTDADGKALLTRSQTIEKKDEAKEFASWWGNRIGDTAKVLKPFEPLRRVKAANNKTVDIACVRRVYELDGLGLPAQVRANGGNVLTAPARLKLKVAGREYSVPLEKALKLTSQKAWKIAFESAPSEIAGVRFSSKGTMEQDGLVTLDLTFAPSKAPVILDALWLEWPLDDSLQNHIVVEGVGGNYSARFIGAVPRGEGVVWDTLSNIGKAGSGMTVGNFYQNIWLGTEQRGLFWWADSDQGWVPSDKAAAHDVVRTGKTLTLRNHFISGRFALEAPRTIHFSYNATPFKKLTPGWRLNQRSACNGFTEKPKYKWNWDTGKAYFSILSPPFPDRKRWPEYYAYLKEVAQKRTLEGGLYAPASRLKPYLTNQIALRGYMEKTLEPGLYKYFGPEWQTPDIGEPLNPTYRDYMVWLMNKQVAEGGARHFYFDISFAGRVSKSISSGFGYLLPDGRIQPSGADGPLREWYKRSAAMMQENGLYPAGISGHATNAIPLAALPFADAILDSEFPMKDPIAVFPSDRMIALSCPHNFGSNINHLGYMNPDWAAFHDAGMGGDHGSVFDRPGWRHWGIGRGDVQFIPYWRNRGVVKKLDSGLISSLWKRPRSVIIGVMNYGLDPAGAQRTRAVHMQLDLAALGVPKNIPSSQIRLRELEPNAVYGTVYGEKYVEQFDWYRKLPGTPLPDDKTKTEKRRPPAAPRFDATTGTLSGFDVFYHDQRYFVLSWDDKPVAPPEYFKGDVRDAVLQWGFGRARDAGRLVKTDKGGLQVSAWQRDHSVLLRISNPGDRDEVGFFTLDLEALGVKVTKDEIWEHFTQLYALDGGPAQEVYWPSIEDQPARWNKTASFDGWSGKLVVFVPKGGTRVLSVDKS
jgi:hypothetical protein